MLSARLGRSPACVAARSTVINETGKPRRVLLRAATLQFGLASAVRAA